MTDRKHYVTPQGFAAYRAELKHLKSVERPEVTKTVAWAASNGDRSENADYQYGKRRLRQIDSRIRFLLKRIESAEVIDPATIKLETVGFGATVTILDDNDKEQTYTIVGIDEGDVSKGRISYQAPLAQALMKKQAGDFVSYTTPRGELSAELLKVEYRTIKEN